MRRLFAGSLGWAIAALLGVGTLILGASPVAQADFTPPFTTQCSGGTATGVPTGLQETLALNWAFEFEEEDMTSPLSCADLGPRIDYGTVTTSAGALEALGSSGGVRNAEFRFVGTEEPPTLAQWLSIDLGDKPGEDSGLIRQIPVASEAVVPIVHFPAGCTVPAGEATTDGRFVVSNSQLEKAYAGELTTWGALLPGIEESCADLPIVRVVPGAADGPTFVFKQWLATVDPSRGWPESGAKPNTSWPNDSGATATVRSEGGDIGEASAVAETSGSIGFASLSNARTERFGFFSPKNIKHKKAVGFWLSVENGANERVEPTRDPNSGEDNVQGANCDDPTFNYVPSGYDTTVTPIWRVVSAAGSKTGWPICTLVYDLAWDDPSTVFGNTEAGQSMQRTVKDFLAYVLGPAGQEKAKARDYSPLPAAVLADAQEGQSRVGWNKVPGSKEEAETAVKAEIATGVRHTQP